VADEPPDRPKGPRVPPARMPSPAPVRLSRDETEEGTHDQGRDDVVKLQVAAGWWQPAHLQEGAEQEFADRLQAGVEEALGWWSTYNALLPSGPTNGDVLRCLRKRLGELEAMDPGNWSGTSRRAVPEPRSTPVTHVDHRPSTAPPPDPRDEPDVFPVADLPLLSDGIVEGWSNDLLPTWSTTNADHAAQTEVILAAQVPGNELPPGEMAAMWGGDFRNERMRAEYMAAVRRAIAAVADRDGRGHPPDRAHRALVDRLVWTYLQFSYHGRTWRHGAFGVSQIDLNIERTITDFVYTVAKLAGMSLEMPRRSAGTVHGWVAEAVKAWCRAAPDDEPRRIDNDQPKQGRR